MDIFKKCATSSRSDFHNVHLTGPQNPLWKIFPQVKMLLFQAKQPKHLSFNGMFQLHIFLNHLLDIENGDVVVMCKYVSSADTCPCDVFPSHEYISSQSLKKIPTILIFYTYMSQATTSVLDKPRYREPGHIGCNKKGSVGTCSWLM